VLITSGKERMPECERAIWIERVSFWTAADDGSPAKWTQQHYLQCQTKEHKFSPGGEHSRQGIMSPRDSLFFVAHFPICFFPSLSADS
jgi:hypothetical protein